MSGIALKFNKHIIDDGAQPVARGAVVPAKT